MFKKKNKQIKTSPNKSNLDQVLWFIENYLPQKKDRGVQKKLYMDNLEAETIKIFSKLASTRSKTLLPTTKNTIAKFKIRYLLIMFLNYLPSEMVEVVGLTMIFSFLVGTILILLFTSDQANTKNLYLKKAK